jgi:hypothetical protein
MKTKALILAVVTVLIASCSADFDESNVMSDYDSMKCLSGSDVVDYEETCLDKSGVVTGFVSEAGSLSRELEIVEFDPEGYDFEFKQPRFFFAEGRFTEHLYQGNKIRLSGVFEDTTFTGKASISVAKFEKMDLTDTESNNRRVKIRNRELDREDGYVLMTHLRCADQAMATYTGSKCPKSKNGAELGLMRENGVITTTGICFFAGRTVILECESSNKGSTVSITNFEVK